MSARGARTVDEGVRRLRYIYFNELFVSACSFPLLAAHWRPRGRRRVLTTERRSQPGECPGVGSQEDSLAH